MTDRDELHALREAVKECAAGGHPSSEAYDLCFDALERVLALRDVYKGHPGREELDGVTINQAFVALDRALRGSD